MPDSIFDQIDTAMATQNNPKTDAAVSAMDDAQGVDPDAHAQNLALATKANLPVDVVERNKPEVEKQTQALSMADKLAILNEAPGTEDFVTKNAKLIADDFSIIGKWNKNLHDFPESLADSAEQQKLIELNNKAMYGGQLSPGDQAEMDVIDEGLQNAQRGTGDFLSKGVQYTGQNAVQIARTVGAGGVGGAVGAAAGLAATALTKNPAIGATVGRWGASVLGGGAAAFENFSQQSALTFNDMRKIKDENNQPLNTDVARGASIAVGMINAGLDVAGLEKLAETFPGFDKLKGALTREGIKKALVVPGMKEAFLKIGQRFATGVGVESITEGAQQATQIIGEELAKKVDGGDFKGKPLDQALDEIWQNFQGGAAMATVLGGIGSGASALGTMRKQGSLTPTQAQAHVDGIHQAVREDKLFQRSPEAFHDLMSSLSGDERFYVNADAATQTIGALPPEQQAALFNAVPDLKTELETAQQTGADVSMKKADYATYIAPYPQADMLRDHVKLDPADTSMAEHVAQKQFLEANPQGAKEVAEQLQGLPPDATYQEQVGAIERLVRKAMLDSGLTPNEARAQASLYARTQARFASAFGQSGIDAINKGLLEFQTVDETGKPIRTGSNFSVLLNDLERMNKGERLPGADENAVGAVKTFGERLKTAGISPEQAKNLSSHELLDQLYPQTENALDIGGQTVTLPDVQVGQSPEGGININVTPGQPSASETDVLRQRYPESKAPERPELKGDKPPETPYNGTTSPEFKEWFGESKVVNEDGSPKVVYHGTDNLFDVFDKEKTSDGRFWFTSDPEKIKSGDTGAAGHGEVIPVYLSAQKLAGWEEEDRFTTDQLIALGYDGMKLDDAYVVFKPEQIKSIFNSGTFSPVDPNILKQEGEGEGPERGFITFNPTQGEDFASRMRKVVVAFTQSKNFSTGAHEFAHWAVSQHRAFAQLARERIAQGDTNPEVQRIAEDWEALKQAVGATDDRFTVEQEEKAAREFEGYMRNGQAPSEALRRTFTRFRDWLVKIYKDLKGLDVEMSPEIHGIFDRWLASEEEIAKVREKNNALAQIAQAMGLPANITDQIADYVNSATAKAEESLYRKLSQEQKRRETQAYKDELASMSKKVAEEFKNIREYNLINYLKTNALKIMEGPETEGIDPEIVSDGGGESVLHPDAVAELYGYDSGKDMLRSLKATKPFDQAVDREARDRLMEKYPDMISQGRIQNEAVDAIVNDRVLLALDLLIKELGRAKGDNSRVGMKQFAIVMAQAQVEKMKASQANYAFRYDVAREKEMRLALQASRAGKVDESLIHLQKAMVNQIIYKNLQSFADMRDRAETLFKRIDGSDKELAPSKDIDFIGAARFLLYKYGLGGEDFDVNGWLNDLDQRDPDVRNDIAFYSQMVAAPRKASGELTVAEFRDIYNAVKNIYETAHNMKEFEIAGKRVKTDDAVAELIEKMGPVDQPLHDSTQITGVNKFRNTLSSAKAALRRVEAWTQAMDGGDSGPFRKYIWQIATDAEDAYKHERTKWMNGYRDILKKYKDLLKQPGKIVTSMLKTGTLGRSTPLVFKDRMELIGFMLHTGNQSNLDKLLGGYGIDKDDFARSMTDMENSGTITAQDWKLTQELWDYVEALKPISQKAHKKLYGFRFDEIENQPITTKFGTFRGGYWPAIADAEQAANNKSVEQMLDETRQYILATTGKGFTKSRVQGYRQPLKTDLRLGSQHIDKVLRFAHLEPATRDIARIINRNEFKEHLRAKDHDAVEGMLMPWLQRFAQQTMEPPATAGDRSAKLGRKIINFMQSATVSQLMRYNPVVALQNIANMPVAAHMIGYPQLAKSFAAVTVNPHAIKDMRAASKMMDERLTTDGIKASQEINAIAERKGKYTDAKDFALRHGFVFMRAIDGYLSAIAWHGAYSNAQSEGKSDADSIAYADSVVRQSMGASTSKDVSKMEASHPAVKLLMPFYSFFNAQANLIGTEFGNVMKAHGWEGSPKMFGAFLSLVLAPALLGQFITDGLRGHLPSDNDDDGDPLDDWLAWALGNTLRYMGAMVPVVGQGVNAIVNNLNNNPMDDRLSISPVVSTFDTAVRAVKTGVKAAQEGDDVRDSRLIRDAMSTFGFMTNLPLGQVAKPLSYVVDVNEGETTPAGPLNYLQGLVAGPPPKK